MSDSATIDPVSAANEWIAGDPDEVTRAELQALVDSGAEDELRERMAGTLEFGTAGIRGRVEAGSNRMNRAVVIRTTRGLADFILATTDDDRGPVVVGRDARPSSPTFLADTVGVLAAAGLSVVYLDEPMPTPIIAFATKELGASAGIVITASHNPPYDNGYKVYDGRGVQIVSPTDQHIAEAIASVGPAGDVPRVDSGSAHPLIGLLRADLRDRYFAEVARSIPGVTGDRSIRIVYTAMHGVGGRFVAMVLDRYGFRNVHPVASQFEPDGRFPTVSFPNPEEPGALDLSHELAGSLDARPRSGQRPGRGPTGGEPAGRRRRLAPAHRESDRGAPGRFPAPASERASNRSSSTASFLHQCWPRLRPGMEPPTPAR